MTTIDDRRLRDLLGRYATGVVAVTGFADDLPTGIAVNSFTSVSLAPPLVAFCVAHTSTTWPRLRTAGRLGVNILGADQHHVCAGLATRSGDKFAGIRWRRSAGGALVVEEVPAWLEVSVTAEHPAGDHTIVVAEVRDYWHEPDQDDDPLVFYRGRYGRFRPAGQGVSAGQGVPAGQGVQARSGSAGPDARSSASSGAGTADSSPRP